VVGGTVGLIDLDDAALGPPELDIGNLRAHLTLLERRSSRDLHCAWTGLVEAYSRAGPALDWRLVHACTRLALLTARVHPGARGARARAYRLGNLRNLSAALHVGITQMGDNSRVSAPVHNMLAAPDTTVLIRDRAFAPLTSDVPVGMTLAEYGVGRRFPAAGSALEC
jgi:hypothetical protein